jgi:ligand-binding sensor domain-containing protein/two-component sensor histidine kinase
VIQSRSVVKKNFLLTVFIFSFLLSLAQTTSLRFEHLTIKDGLSQSLIYNIFQDSYGYLWIATQDGLNRYDGYEFKVFKNNPFDSTTLTHNWVWTVQEDNRGDIWAGTFQGLCRYIRKEDRFVQYYYKVGDTTSISGNRPNYILKDKQNRLWISSWGRGLNLYDQKTNSFKRFMYDANDPKSLSDNFVRTLFCDNNGTIWIGTWNGGLNKIIEDESGISFKHFGNKKEYGLEGGNRITSMAADQENNLWIANYESGLVRYNQTHKTFERMPFYDRDDVNRIICDSKGDMWIGTNKGLGIYDHKTKTIQKYLHNTQNEFTISSNIVYALMEDRSGIIWVSGNGLDKCDPHKNVFKTFRNEPDNKNTLSQNMVRSFCEDDKGKIWIGTESGAVNIYDPKTNSFSQLHIRDGHGNEAPFIHCIAQQKDVIWMASAGAGLIRYDTKTGKSFFYNGSHPSPLGKISHTDEVLVDDDNTLWITSNENGLFRLDPKTDQVKQYNHSPNDPHSLASDFLNAIYKDKQGNIWICFWGGGMSMFDKTRNQFINYVYDRKNVNGLSDQVVNSIQQQNDSIYWICTQTGLNRLNVNTKRFRHFFETDGLISNAVYEMLPDRKGNYWISSNGGLSYLDTKTFQFKNYTEDDGLQSNEFSSNAALKSKNGLLYFGGIKGFNVFNSDEIVDNKMPTKVILQQYRIYNKLFIPSDVVSLRHHQNYLSFQFAAIEFSAPKKIRYAYKLENFDQEWVNIGNNREAFYTNLDPGSYVFKVKASNTNGYWSDEETKMTIIISPPYWSTWWFITLVIILIAALAYGVHRYRLRQTLHLERLRNKIASDLHDEVGSSLTRISIYSDLLQSGVTAQENANYLKRINEVSREVVGTMSDIVWSIDNRNDSFEALILRMKDFANEVLQSKNIEIEFLTNVNTDKILDPELKQNLYLIFKEAINNIVKHAQASHVKIQLVNNTDQFTMTIHDNGKGFVQEKVPRGNGLRNMERRAKAMNAEFGLHSNSGTTLSVKRGGI